MKNILIIFILVLIGSGISAQNGPTMAEKATTMKNSITDVITVSPEQDTDLYNINMTFLQELQAARNNSDKNAMKQAHITRKNAIAATLTEEQMTTLKNARSRNKEG